MDTWTCHTTVHASNLRAFMHIGAVQHDGDNRRGEGRGDNRQVYAVWLVQRALHFSAVHSTSEYIL